MGFKIESQLEVYLIIKKSRHRLEMFYLDKKIIVNFQKT